MNEIKLISFIFISSFLQPSWSVDIPNVMNQSKHGQAKEDGFNRIQSGIPNIGIINSSLPRKHLNIVTLELAPFMMKREGGSNNNSIEWYGYCMDFFEELVKNLPYRLSYEIYQVHDNKFGTKTKKIFTEIDKDSKRNIVRTNERWTGLIGELQSGKADLALAPLAVMAERELVIDFTVPFYDLVGIQILLKKPEVPRDIFKFLTVLDGEVWLSIMVAYFVTSFVIFLFDRLSPYSLKNLNRIKNSKSLREHEVEMTGGNAHLIENMGGASLRDRESIYPHGMRQRFSDQNQQVQRQQTITDNQIASSWSKTIKEAGRRSSMFLVNGFESLLSGVGPENTSESLNEQLRRAPRGSIVTSVGGTDITGHDEGKPEFGFKDSLWFCITSLTPQGGGEAPMNLSGRIVAGAWWLFCFIIIASYTANLAAFLTVSRLDIPIESLDDLAKQYRIKYAPVEGTAEHAYFERMAYIEEIFYNIWRDMTLNESLSEEERSKFAVWDYPISDKYTKIWTQIKKVGMPLDYEIGIKRVKSSNLEDGFALLADANTIKHAVMTDCSFKAVGDEFSRKPIALGLRKGNDHFRDELSHVILKLINQRFMEILREKWWTNNPNRVDCDTHEESEGIGIENIGGVFIIIAAGVLLSFVVWTVERFAYNTKIEIAHDLIKDQTILQSQRGSNI